MVRPRLIRDVSTARPAAVAAYPPDSVDEYRELTILAGAWERGWLEPRVTDGASGEAADAKGKEPLPR